MPVIDGDDESQETKADEGLELPKETLEDLDAPEEAGEDAKGGFRSSGCQL